jgi:hypothetical protein
MTDMMKGVVCEGTGKGAQIPGISVAGKTGTAYKVQDDNGVRSCRQLGRIVRRSSVTSRPTRRGSPSSSPSTSPTPRRTIASVARPPRRCSRRSRRRPSTNCRSPPHPATPAAGRELIRHAHVTLAALVADASLGTGFVDPARTRPADATSVSDHIGVVYDSRRVEPGFAVLLPPRRLHPTGTSSLRPPCAAGASCAARRPPARHRRAAGRGGRHPSRDGPAVRGLLRSPVALAHRRRVSPARTARPRPPASSRPSWNQRARPTGVIGTLTGKHTTPEAPDLQAQLASASWRMASVSAVVMEVSSHALQLHRVDRHTLRTWRCSPTSAAITSICTAPSSATSPPRRLLFEPSLSERGVVNSRRPTRPVAARRGADPDAGRSRT